jgi:uncharacterized protein YrrD
MFLLSDFEKKIITTKRGGEKLGTATDFMIDPQSLEVAAVITSTDRAIPSNEVEEWDQDIILVKREDAAQDKQTLTDQKDWMSMKGQLRGLNVHSDTGQRLGEVDDIVIDMRGQIIAFELQDNHPVLKVGQQLGQDEIGEGPEHQVGQQIGQTTTDMSAESPALRVGHKLDERRQGEKPELQIGRQLSEHRNRIPAQATRSLDPNALTVNRPAFQSTD